MTEKRYYLKCDEINAWSIHETDGDIIVFDLLKSDAELVCDLLNKLNDENEQLKSSLSAYMVDLNNYKGKCSALEEENEHLNKQLKSITDSLQNELNYHGFMSSLR